MDKGDYKFGDKYYKIIEDSDTIDYIWADKIEITKNGVAIFYYDGEIEYIAPPQSYYRIELEGTYTGK